MSDLIVENFDNGVQDAQITSLPNATMIGPGLMQYDAASATTGAFGALTTVASTNRYIQHNLTTLPPVIWQTVDLIIPGSLPGQIYVAGCGSGSERICDWRINANLSITLRDYNLAKFTSPILTPGPARVSYKAIPNTVGGLRMKIWSGTNYNGTLPNYDSGDGDSTRTNAPFTLAYADQARTGIVVVPSVANTISLAIDHIYVTTHEPVFSVAAKTNVKKYVNGTFVEALSFKRSSEIVR